MKIILKDDIPVYQSARRLAFSKNQDVKKQIDEWLEQGIVRPSLSEYASPIVLVKKKDDTTRLYVDYRKLNRKLVKNHFPLPLIEDVLDELQEAKVYTTLDLKNGFFHVDVNEDYKHLTSFVVPDGQFEFNKVPFGLSTSPSVFQRYVYSIFRELMRKGVVIIYMDDLIIPAKDEKEGLEKLKEVLEVASKYGLEMKFKKCQFLRKKVEFLDHVVENGTIRPSIAKTIAVKKFPVPTTVKQVQSFLGLTGYFRKFIPAYSQIAKPLSDLTRKDNPFMFEQPQMEAFQKIKKLLTESPVLSIFQQGKTTELHTDASQQGYGAVLLQEAEDGKLHPAQYMSQKTTPVWFSRPTTGVLLAPCHDEFRGPRSDYVRQVALETTATTQNAYTLHKPIRHKFQRNRVFVSDIDRQFQADLVDMQSLAEFNKGYKYLLTCIDLFSKFAWAVPLKDKFGKSVKSGLEIIFKERKPKVLQTDAGNMKSEFVADAWSNFSVFYVYSDLISPQIVGDTQAPLLRIVRTKGKDGETISQYYDRPQYLPLVRHSFQTIQSELSGRGSRVV
ncbi:retrovirus-related Pol polyprotein from transposon 17.6 [Trichonephila clavipes]|nr:retrovirus-related Pol polyprotein from transposon 17.6 [Trichonephila clavipes]